MPFISKGSSEPTQDRDFKYKIKESSQQPNSGNYVQLNSVELDKDTVVVNVSIESYNELKNGENATEYDFETEFRTETENTYVDIYLATSGGFQTETINYRIEVLYLD